LNEKIAEFKAKEPPSDKVLKARLYGEEEDFEDEGSPTEDKKKNKKKNKPK